MKRALHSLVALAVALVTSLGVVEAAAAAGSGPPYTDPTAVGYIGLCNSAGHQITSGDVDTVPFAWRAVSSVPAPSPYNDAWRTATLYGYQPQQGLLAGEWSGEALTASSRYSNPADPMVAATDGDDSLEDFIQDFPPRWDGFLELRIFLGTQNEEAYEAHYPVLNIKVTGKTWSAVGGGTVNCASGTSESLETIVLPPTTTVPGSKGVTSATSTVSGTNRGGTSGGTGTGTHPSGSRGAPRSSATGSDGHLSAVPADSVRAAGHGPLIVGLIALVVLLAAATGFVVTRRRHLSIHPSPSSSTRASSTKGKRP